MKSSKPQRRTGGGRAKAATVKCLCLTNSIMQYTIEAMKFYFSGVSGASEYGMLAAAGVRHILVDQFDLPISLGSDGSLIQSSLV